MVDLALHFPTELVDLALHFPTELVDLALHFFRVTQLCWNRKPNKLKGLRPQDLLPDRFAKFLYTKRKKNKSILAENSLGG